MKNGLQRLFATGLAFAILVLPGTLSARERRGANIVVTMKSGQSVSGELIAVKPDSLLLFAGKDESVDLVGIRSIRIVKKDKALLGAICGLLAGDAAGIIYGHSRPEREAAGLSVLVFVPAGVIIGAGAGLFAGKDKIIQLEAMPESEVGKALAYLRGKARIRDHE